MYNLFKSWLIIDEGDIINKYIWMTDDDCTIVMACHRQDNLFTQYDTKPII